ncbi:MAG: hypothetical protein JWP14_1249 [Frankiales bacterium]|nr:hypothetical protein [Frankiales bacterium]
MSESDIASSRAALATVDRLDILELYARYARLVDDDCFSAWVDCFTDRGVLAVPAMGVRAQGAAELEAFARRQAEVLPRPQRHLMLNILVDAGDDVDEAQGAAYLLLIGGGWNRQPPRIHTSGRYQDHLVRRAGSWKFHERVLTLDEAASGAPPDDGPRNGGNTDERR